MVNSWEREAGCNEYDSAQQKIQKVVDYEGKLSADMRAQFNSNLATSSYYIPGSGKMESATTVRGMLGYGLMLALPALAFCWSVRPGPIYWSLVTYWFWSMFIVSITTLTSFMNPNINKAKTLPLATLILSPFPILLAASYLFWGGFDIPVWKYGLGKNIVLTICSINIVLLCIYAKAYNSRKK